MYQSKVNKLLYKYNHKLNMSRINSRNHHQAITLKIWSQLICSDLDLS